MSVESVEAIDVHGHYGTYDCGRPNLINELMTGDGAEVARRARQARTRWTVVSPLSGLLPRGKGDPVAGNRECAAVVARTDGLLQYVIVSPLHPETYRQADELLQTPRCVGIKLHPEEHLYNIAEHGRELFAFAAEHRAVVLVHSSERRSLAADYVRFANDFPEVKLILAHIGCGWDGDYTHQVRGIQASRHGNVWADTSSARSITPKLIEWAVKEVGAERVLYGTDTPLYFSVMQRARIDHADLPDRDKRLILRENAVRLLNLGARGL
jgi:predicted TIM-barrel fold metal-dependent hydrolase